MRTSLLSLSLLSTALAACNDPPSPSEVRQRISEDLGYVLHEGQSASDASTKDLPTGTAFGLLTSSTDTASARLLAPLARKLSVKDRVLSADGTSDFDPDALIKTLNEELFTDANYLGDGIYRVPASLVCKTTTYDPSGVPTTTIDPDCAQALEKAQLRVRVEDDEGLRFWIQLDADHDEPLGILLRHDEVAITINLDDATDAMIALAAVFGEQAPNADLSGQITGALTIIGQAHAKVALTFDRAISIKVADQGVGLDSADAFRFTSAAAHVLSVELDGNANTPKASVSLGLGQTTAHAPGDVDPPTDYFLGGATVEASYQANTLHLDHISLGTQTTTVKVGGQLAASIDLNPDDGRALDATITGDPATGIETLAVSPRLDMRTTVDHALLGDTQPVYDVTRVLLDGSLRSTGVTDQIEVASGSFSISTNPAQFGFSAAAGQCVLGHDTFDSTTSEYYTQFTVGACP